MNNTTKSEPFKGFRSPNYTMVPDELFDELLPVLSGSELKVLMYIIRRTFGFKRESDTISLSQMLNGISSTKDGVSRILDRGAGVSKPSLLQALRGLQAKNIVFAERQVSDERGNGPTLYRPNVQLNPLGKETYLPLVKKSNQGGGQETLPSPRARNLTTQDTVLQETVEQQTDISFEHSNIRMVQPEKGRTEIADGRPATRGRAISKSFAPPGDILAPGVGNASLTKGTAPESGIEMPVGKGQGRPAGRPRPETQTEEWQTIQQYIGDFMRELGDRASLKSSTTRAHNLFLASGVSLGVFVGKLYEARSRTQESSGNIEQTVDDPTYRVKRKTKAAYFFAVLEDVLHLIDEEERKRREAGTGTKRGRPPKAAGDTPNSSNGDRERDSDGPFGAFVER